jgi:hypothetical protein
MKKVDITALIGVRVSVGYRSIMERLPKGEYIIEIVGECGSLGSNGSAIVWLTGTVIAPDNCAGRTVRFPLSVHAITMYNLNVTNTNTNTNTNKETNTP